MVKSFGILTTLLCITTEVVSQTSYVEDGSRRGLIEVSASIYPTFSMNKKSSMNFVGGHLAYQLDDKYSLRGDVLVMTSTQSGTPVYNDYFLIETGVLRNFTVKRFDYFVGLEFGLAALQNYQDEINLLENLNHRYYQPVWDLTTGFKFHVSNYFYFYAEAKLLNNRNPEANGLQTNLSVTGGLGLQLPTKKLRELNQEGKRKRKFRYI